MEVNKNDLISIVVPVYNVEKYLDRCVKTLISQTYENIEIILVDDGATDSSDKMCDEYLKIDKRIKVIHKENGGLSDARNVGIENASGKYIALVDSDDYINKDFIKVLYEICIENDANIAQCSFLRVTDKQEENPNKAIQFNNKVTVMSGKDAIFKIFGSEYVEYTVAWNRLYEKNLFDNIKYPKGKLHEDEATTYKLFYEAKKVAVTDAKLYYYYIRENSITNTKYTLKRLDLIDELEEQLEYFKDRNEEKLYIEAYYRYSRSLIQAYHRCKKNIDDSEKVQLDLMNKYRNSVEFLKKKKEISFKRKIILLFGYTFPNLFGKIFVKD